MRRYRVLCVVWVLLWSTTALAQTRSPQEAREEASAHFHRGVELFEEGAFRPALVEFKRAYEIAPNYRLLFNMGQTQLELQDFLGAAQSYEFFLLQGGSQIPQAQRDQLEGALQALRARVGRIVLAVSRDGAEVFLDDNLIGKSPIASTIPVNVGQHRISVKHPDGGTGSKVVEVAGGEIAEVAIALSEPTPTTIVMADTRRPLATKLAIIGWGTGGALLLGSLVTGVMAMSADKDFDDLLGRVITDPKKESDQRSKLKTLVVTTDVLLATGVVVAAAGTVMWMLGRREERKREEERQKSAKLHFDVGLGSLSLRGQF